MRVVAPTSKSCAAAVAAQLLRPRLARQLQTSINASYTAVLWSRARTTPSSYLDRMAKESCPVGLALACQQCMKNITRDLLLLLQGHNAFIRKNLNHTTFSAEPGNLYNKHSYKHSGAWQQQGWVRRSSTATASLAILNN